MSPRAAPVSSPAVLAPQETQRIALAEITNQDDGDLEVATTADHLRHVARTAQQLTAALAVHLDILLEAHKQNSRGDKQTAELQEEC